MLRAFAPKSPLFLPFETPSLSLLNCADGVHNFSFTSLFSMKTKWLRGEINLCRYLTLSLMFFFLLVSSEAATLFTLTGALLSSSTCHPQAFLSHPRSISSFSCHLLPIDGATGIWCMLHSDFLPFTSSAANGLRPQVQSFYTLGAWVLPEGNQAERVPSCPTQSRVCDLQRGVYQKPFTH